jgi:hypothetical protein
MQAVSAFIVAALGAPFGRRISAGRRLACRALGGASRGAAWPIGRAPRMWFVSGPVDPARRQRTDAAVAGFLSRRNETAPRQLFRVVWKTNLRIKNSK